MNVAELKSRLNPSNEKHSAVLDILSRVQMMKGEDGKTPKKGVDYFTPAEINDLFVMIRKEIKTFEKGLKGDKGEQGAPGVSGIGRQGAPGKDGAKGKDGKTPVHGIDYFTPKDQDILINRILAKIKLPKIMDIVEKVREVPVNYKDVYGAPDLTDLPKLIAFLKMGGFRGGGGSSTGTVAIVYTETPSGLINSVNTTFTVLHAITNVYSFALNGQFLHPVTDYSVSGSTITFVTAPDISLAGLPFTITYS